MAKSVKVSYLQMSDTKCLDCNRPIKKNVVYRQNNANKCYICFKLSKGIYFIPGKGKLKDIQEKQKVTYSEHEI